MNTALSYSREPRASIAMLNLFISEIDQIRLDVKRPQDQAVFVETTLALAWFRS